MSLNSITKMFFTWILGTCLFSCGVSLAADKEFSETIQLPECHSIGWVRANTGVKGQKAWDGKLDEAKWGTPSPIQVVERNWAWKLDEAQWKDAVKLKGEGKKEETSFQLWIPDGPPIKGIVVISGHGSGEALYKHPELRKLARQLHLAIFKFLGNPMQRGFWPKSLLQNRLKDFAKKSNHPELEHAPLFLYGHSNGTGFSALFAAMDNQRVWGWVSMRPGITFQVYQPDAAKVPGLVIFGEDDPFLARPSKGENLAVVEAMRKNHRALWNQAVEPKTGHGPGEKTWPLVFSFLRHTFSARVPVNADTTKGPVTLKNLAEDSGHLGKNWDSEKGGYQTLAIAPFDSFQQNKSVASWLINAEYAADWQSFQRDGQLPREPLPKEQTSNPNSAADTGQIKTALNPLKLWMDFDPNKGDFKEEIVKQEIQNGILSRDSYISAYVNGEEVRVYCRYSVKIGAVNAPGLMDVHGWMGAPNPNREYIRQGWAVMAHDYCGKTANREHYTKYPLKLAHGNMDRGTSFVIRTETMDGKSITDPKQTSDYLWYAIQRRVLSYLAKQKEVDPKRLAGSGYSYGGTLMWNLGTDPRIKAIVARFGIGYNDYYRSKQVWMYNLPYVEPPKSPGEELYIATIAPEAHVPYIQAATLFLNGSNDHHGGHERGLESFKKFSPKVPWSFAIQARGHHDTDKIEQDSMLWLDKHVLDKKINWPGQPISSIRLDATGVPELVVAPDMSDKIRKVEIYYALKNPCSFTRAWRDTPAIHQGSTWTAKMPVLNTDDYVFGFANITYDSTIVRSTNFEAAIPSKLGKARATDKQSEVISSGSNHGIWTNIAEVEGPKGIKGFRPTSNQKGSETEQLSDPKWKSPEKGQLNFKYYCTEPQNLILTAGDHYLADIEIKASDNWQEMTVQSSQLKNRFDQRTLQSWSSIGKIHFKPQQGSDITKVIFAEFKWVKPVQ